MHEGDLVEYVGEALKKTHDIKKEETAEFIDSIVPGTRWGKTQSVLEDRLNPQRGIRVVDGF